MNIFNKIISVFTVLLMICGSITVNAGSTGNPELVTEAEIFSTNFDMETQVFLYSTFNVNRGDKGSVVYGFAASPANNDGSEKSGQSIKSTLAKGKVSCPRAEVVLDSSIDYSSGYYKLSYSFYLSENHMTNNLVMLRSGKNDIPLLSVGESGNYVVSSSELDKACELEKWHTAEITICMAGTENPNTFTVYADGELISENTSLGKTDFDKLTAYHTNAGGQAASVYLDDISFELMKISDGTQEPELPEDEEVKTDIETEGELPDLSSYVVRNDIFTTNFDSEPDTYLSNVFNVYGGDKGSVVYAFSPSPAKRDGSPKDGRSIRSELTEGKASYPRANVYFDKGYDSGMYHLSYSFYLEENHAFNNLVMLRQGTADVPLLSVGEDGMFQTLESKLGFECITGRWHDVDILIYLAGTPSPKTFDIYINGNEAAKGCSLSRSSFNRICAYLHNDSQKKAVSYLDDIALREIVENPGAPTVQTVACPNDETLKSVPVDDATLEIEFSHEIDIEKSVPEISVRDEAGNVYETDFVLSPDCKTIVLSFTDVLLMAKSYTLEVDKITDIYGNIMETAYSKDFATQKEGFSISNLSLTDQDGSIAEAIPKEKLNAGFTVQNMTQADASACLIAAVIKPNGKVRSYSIDDSKVTAGSIRSFKVTLDTASAKEGDTVRIFIWDGFETMNPLGEYTEIKNFKEEISK